MLNFYGRGLEGGGLSLASSESNRGRRLKSANELGEFPSLVPLPETEILLSLIFEKPLLSKLVQGSFRKLVLF